jgi:transcription elongation factor Elf1
MALQYCPKCKKLSFTWCLDEEQTPLTQWHCYCGYYALENESKQRDCPVCDTEKAYSYMIDAKNKYWWCHKCGKIEVIEILSAPFDNFLPPHTKTYMV